MRVSSLPKAASWKRTGRDSNPRPFGSRANALPLTVKPHRPGHENSIIFITAAHIGRVLEERLRTNICTTYRTKAEQFIDVNDGLLDAVWCVPTCLVVIRRICRRRHAKSL